MADGSGDEPRRPRASRRWARAEVAGPREARQNGEADDVEQARTEVEGLGKGHGGSSGTSSKGNPSTKAARLGAVDECVSPPPFASDGDLRSGRGKGRGGTRRQFHSGPDSQRGGNSTMQLASESFNSGVQSAFRQRYAADLDRLRSRPDLPPTARWMDSHCHLESILARTWRGGGKPQVLKNEPLVDLAELCASWPHELDGCINVCAFRRPSKPGNPTEYDWLKENLCHYDPSTGVGCKLWFTVGIHPHDAANWDAQAEQLARQLASHPRCVGIGECGLDFFKHDLREADMQLRAFRAQAALAVELNKALVVHARLVTPQNEDLFLRELEQAVPLDHRIHIHCYSDSLRHALDLCQRWPNLRIGFTGAITFRDRGKGKGKDEKKGEAHCKELIQGIPLERLLIETDGPYMCPEPFRGHTAHPGHVHRVAEKISEWQGVPLGQVMDATRKSTTTVYGI